MLVQELFKLEVGVHRVIMVEIPTSTTTLCKQLVVVQVVVVVMVVLVLSEVLVVVKVVSTAGLVVLQDNMRLERRVKVRKVARPTAITEIPKQVAAVAVEGVLVVMVQETAL